MGSICALPAQPPRHSVGPGADAAWRTRTCQDRHAVTGDTGMVVLTSASVWVWRQTGRSHMVFLRKPRLWEETPLQPRTDLNEVSAPGSSAHPGPQGTVAVTLQSAVPEEEVLTACVPQLQSFLAWVAPRPAARLCETFGGGLRRCMLMPQA